MAEEALETKPAVYVETTVVSYFTSLPSRDVLVLAHQVVTKEWWDRSLPQLEIFVSPVVVDEIQRGDPIEAAKRSNAISNFAVLSTNNEIAALSAQFADALRLPKRARADADHLAFAAWHGMDYLVTWNCAHIASAMVRRTIERILVRQGIQPPVICTPEELLLESS